MKATLLGLVLSTTAFAGSSVYLWTQLREERSAAAKVAEANEQLAARVANLEKTRVQFGMRPPPGPNTFEGAVARHVGPGPEAGPRTERQEEKAVWTARPVDPAMKRPEMPPAMLKMMRAQMRKHLKEQYFDVGDRLGLSEQQTTKLLDLMAQHQSESMTQAHNQDPNAVRASWETLRDKQKSEITDLLGPAKAAQLEEFNKTLPARGELMMMAQQLEGADVPLNDDQRRRLLDAFVDERARVPMPEISAATDQESITKMYADWQNDYEARIAAQARGILSTEQMNTYDQYQQWQKEMRESFAAQGLPAMRPGRTAGGAVTYASPPTAIGGNVVTMGVLSAAPAAPPENEKPKK